MQLKQNIVYDEMSRQYVYNRPSDSAFSSSTTTTFTSVTTETKQFRTNAKVREHHFLLEIMDSI